MPERIPNETGESVRNDLDDEKQLGYDDWVRHSDGRGYRITDEVEEIERDGEITPHVCLDSAGFGMRFIPSKEFDEAVEKGHLTQIEVDPDLDEMEQVDHRERVEEILGVDEPDHLERVEMYSILDGSGYEPHEMITLARDETDWTLNTAQVHAEVSEFVDPARPDRYQDHEIEKSQSRGQGPQL